MTPLLLIPNLGAEEGERQGPPQAAQAARLWRLLFAPEALGPDGTPDPLADHWPGALGPLPDGPALPRQAGSGDAVAWLNDARAAQQARAAGRRLSGTDPERVQELHDKAWAWRQACAERLVPPALRDLVEPLDSDLLGDPTAATARLRECLARWPAWTDGAFVLKPRLGTSGRGRVAGRADDLDAPALRGAFPRLAAQGGAMLEPWLRRAHDLSAQLWIDEDAGVTLLGTLELRVTPAGVVRGHRGTFDRRGRVTSGLEDDEALREAAGLLGVAARERGCRGPCGVDAFRFVGEDGPLLRPVVEFNARFTLGTVVIGLLRRTRPRVPDHFRLDAGQRVWFHFGLEAPPDGWPADRSDGSLLTLPLGPDPATGPALVFAATRQVLEKALGA